MIVEHELIEQIEEEPVGRPLDWCARLAGELGARDPLVTLHEMYRAGYLRLADSAGKPLSRWQAEQVWREGVARADVAVLATDLGSQWVHG